MAGHSKWSNIKHRKAAQDKKKAKVFTRMIREVTVAARLGGDDPEANPRLRAAIQDALAANMPKDTIDRAIKRGAGQEDGSNLEEIRYEGYAPGGIAVMVDCMTDNKNRTVSEVRHAFSKMGGNLGTNGSVSYLFEQKGIIHFEQGEQLDIMEIAIDAGAEDIDTQADSTDIITTPEDYSKVYSALQQANCQPDGGKVTMVALTDIDIDDIDLAQKILKLIDMLEDLDDVQNVYTNASIADNIMDQIN